jgi:hypothetical protein
MSIPLPAALSSALQELPDLTSAVEAVLESATVHRMNVRVGPVHVAGADYRQVAQAMHQNRIRVLYDPHHRMVRDSRSAYYDAGFDVMAAGFRLPSDLPMKALVVHESTHAANDVRSRSLIHADDEAGAYVAQMMYLRLAGVPSPQRMTAPDPQIDRIYETAMAVADGLLAHQSVTAATASLVAAIRAWPYYGGTASQSAGYNGI